MCTNQREDQWPELSASGNGDDLLMVAQVKENLNKLNSIPARGTLLEQLPTELPRLLQLVEQAHGAHPPPPAAVSEHTEEGPSAPAAALAPAPTPVPAPEPAPEQPSGAAAAAGAMGLDAFLEQLNLQTYTEALKKDLGAATPADLKDLEEADMDELGLKKLEKKRLMRALEAL